MKAYSALAEMIAVLTLSLSSFLLILFLILSPLVDRLQELDRLPF